MLSDSQIMELGKRMNVPIEGIYFKDEIPKIKTNKSYIVNLQDSETDDGEQNGGTHWVYLEVREYPNGKIEPFYFDPYGAPPPEIVKKKVKEQFKKYLPYSNIDIQSMMNEACGYYCLAMGHYLNAFKHRCGNIYLDASSFIDMFDDLNVSIDWKKNEYILKQFFMEEDPNKRMSSDVFGTGGDDKYERIVKEGCGRPDIAQLPVDVKYVN
jgi:hypothetical protein